MKFPHLAVLALFFVGVVGIDARPLSSAEDYWHSIWPDTPMPKNLQQLLKPTGNGEIKDTQYPYTSFFEDDLYPGKQMNIKFNKNRFAQPFGVGSWKKAANGASNDATINTVDNTDVEDTQYPYTSFFEDDLYPGKQMSIKFNKNHFAQPFGVGSWKKVANGASNDATINNADNTNGEDTQYPYTSFFEDDLYPGKQMNIKFNKNRFAQPFGVGSWKKVANGASNDATINTVDNTDIEDTQYPYTSFFEDDLHPGKQMNIKFNKNRFAQPFGVGSWKKVANGASSDATINAAVISTTENTNVESVERKTKRLPIKEICEKWPLFVGENSRICAKSVKSLVDFVISKLGKDVEPLSSSFVPHQTQYTILKGVQKVAEKGVMCHKLNSQKPVFYCHQVNASIAYIVPMEAADGTTTKAVVICHHDTRGLDPHILFHQLKVMPGTVPVCHFIGSKALVWVPKINKAAT